MEIFAPRASPLKMARSFAGRWKRGSHRRGLRKIHRRRNLRTQNQRKPIATWRSQLRVRRSQGRTETMGFLNKLGIGIGTQPAREGARPIAGDRGTHKGNGSVVAVGTNRAPEPQETTRGSNGLKEFLWNLDGLGRGTLLDLGPAWQTTLTFFIERGFRVTSDDILRDWSQFLAEEDAKAKAGGKATPESYAERLPEARAK